MTITLPLDAEAAAPEAVSAPTRQQPNSWIESQREAFDAEALYRELAALSDEELAKRGIERSGIARAVHARFYGGR